MITGSISQIPDSVRDSTAMRFSSHELLIDRDKLDVVQKAELERMAFQHACVPESYDIAVSAGHLLQTTCGQGIASVLADGRFWHIAGGLLAAEPAKADMIQWLYELSVNQRKTIAVYNVSELEAATFKAAGFVVNKFGEEPVVDLPGGNWNGKPFEWVRRQANFCERAGLVFSEVTEAANDRPIAGTLLEIMHEDLRDRTFSQPLRLLEGQFNPFLLQRRRLFLATAASGRVEGFLACSPINGGRSWAFETYRKRKDATRGTTAYLFKSAMDTLRAEGVEAVSLCLVPGRRVGLSSLGAGDWRIQKSLSLWYERLEFVFNAKGQDHFKSRFRPRYEDRYLCVAPANSVRSLWSFLKTTGATHPSWKNLASQFWKSVRG